MNHLQTFYYHIIHIMSSHERGLESHVTSALLNQQHEREREELFTQQIAWIHPQHLEFSKLLNN